MSRDTHDEVIWALERAIGYVNYAKRISALPNCNDCGKRRDCEHKPKLGETVRINCYDWVAPSRKNCKADNEKDGV